MGSRLSKCFLANRDNFSPYMNKPLVRWFVHYRQQVVFRTVRPNLEQASREYQALLQGFPIRTCYNKIVTMFTTQLFYFMRQIIRAERRDVTWAIIGAGVFIHIFVLCSADFF